MLIKEYHWQHMKSLEGSINRFDEAQLRSVPGQTFTDAELEALRAGQGIPQEKALLLVNSWNSTSPAYKYWI